MLNIQKVTSWKTTVNIKTPQAWYQGHNLRSPTNFSNFSRCVSGEEVNFNTRQRVRSLGVSQNPKMLRGPSSFSCSTDSCLYINTSQYSLLLCSQVEGCYRTLHCYLGGLGGLRVFRTKEVGRPVNTECKK